MHSLARFISASISFRRCSDVGEIVLEKLLQALRISSQSGFGGFCGSRGPSCMSFKPPNFFSLS